MFTSSTSVSIPWNSDVSRTAFSSLNRCTENGSIESALVHTRSWLVAARKIGSRSSRHNLAMVGCPLTRSEKWLKRVLIVRPQDSSQLLGSIACPPVNVGRIGRRIELGPATLIQTRRNVNVLGIASVVPVPDAEARRIMAAFHRQLDAGDSPAAALARAQAGRAVPGFICLGRG
jgi:hypothetical protein